MARHAASPTLSGDMHVSHLRSLDSVTFGHTMLMPHITGADVLPPVYDQLSETHNLEVLGPHPARLRETLRGLSPEDAAKFDEYLGKCALPVASGRHDKLTHKPEGRLWASWIAEEAEPEEVLGVLTQHNLRVSELNKDPVVEDLLDSRREWVADRLVDGVESGWLHQDMKGVATRLRGKVKAWFGDDLQDKVLRSGAQAYCAPKRTYVVLGQHMNIVDPKQRREAVTRGISSNEFPHELLHASEVAEWLPVWMLEVGVEDITQSILHKGDLSTSLQPYPEAGFFNRREVRQTMLKKGRHEIEDETYIMAISSMSGDTPEVKRLMHELDYSWGVKNMLGYITRRLKTYETQLLEEDKRQPSGLSKAFLLAEAAFIVNDELQKEPEMVFGKSYKKPQPHLGAAAVGRVRVK